MLASHVMPADDSTSFRGLLDVGGRGLYAEVTGRGDPPVVFDNGNATSLARWGSVPAEAARTTRVVTYDRAGIGRSDPAPRPRTSRNIVADLRALLAALDVFPPYILVGHSFGAINVRLFATLHPDEVAGLVLVDPANEDQYARSLDDVPPEKRAARESFLLGANPEGLDQLASAGQLRAAGSLPTLRPVVLSSNIPPNAASLTPEDIDAMRQRWHGGHAAIASRVPNSVHLIAERSRHFIQEDQPDLVLDAVRSLVDDVRVSLRRSRHT